MHCSSRKKAIATFKKATTPAPRVSTPKRTPLFPPSHIAPVANVFTSIIQDPKNPALYTNRAMARLKLALWDSVVADCQSVLTLPSGGSNIKAHYYLCQAQLALHDADGALSSGLRAHALCVASHDKSLAAVTAAVLKAKKARWEQREKQRARGEADLERDVLRLLRAEAATDIAQADGDSERQLVEEEAKAKEERIMAVFERSRVLAGDGRREVPDWAVDDISFGFMVDPVVTRTGKSYERASILEHLRRSATDPLTREPLAVGDLRPNMALRQACEEFLFENGWAADW